MTSVAGPAFTVVIPAWNESAFIAAAVESAKLAIKAVPFSGTIIVVDNNSTDDTADKARRAGATVVFEPVNQIARARNAGANASNSDWLVFVDADSELSPALLQLALDALASGDVIGGGSVIAPDRPVSGMPAFVIALWNKVSVWTRTVAGCFVFCRRDAFARVGGFSDKVYAGEELLLSRQLKKLARKERRAFVVLTEAPMVTSVRKIDWYSPAQLFRQFVLLLIPGAIYSKRLCGMWYERGSTSKERSE